MFLLAVGMMGTISQSCRASDEVKTIAKIVWHGAEIYVGIMLFKKMRLKLDFENCTNAVGAASLTYHGCKGLDKTLKLRKKLQEFFS